MKLTIVSDNRVLAEQFHMKSGSYSSCQLFFPLSLFCHKIDKNNYPIIFKT